VTETLKKRLVLDLSREVNKCIPGEKTKLADLSVSEQLIEEGDFMTVFDLRNMFFHVRLHPNMYRYFGFALPNEEGGEDYYVLKVLVYGCKPAVNIVTKLLQPVTAFWHSLGIKQSIYVDNGRVVAAGTLLPGSGFFRYFAQK